MQTSESEDVKEETTVGARLNLLVILSPDIERTAEFYSLLGFSFERRRHGQGPEHMAAEVDGFVFEIYPETERSGRTTALRIGFAVANVDREFEKLIQSGAGRVVVPTDSEWGRRAVILDIDGHVVELTGT